MKAPSPIARPAKVIAIFFLIIGVLFSTFSTSRLPSAHAQQEGPISLSGWFTTKWGDSQDGSLTKEIHVLSTADGQSVPLLLDEGVAAPAGGLLALDRKHITVSGDWSKAISAQGGPAALQVTSIAAPKGAEAALPAVTGTQKYISIMCKFQGNAAEPNNLAYFQNMYANSYPGMDHYWREQSYNSINVMGSTAAGWFVLPHPHDYYISGGWFNLTQAAIDCTGVANPTVNFSSYKGINLMFNDLLDGYAWGGGEYLTLDGVTKVWNMTWEPPWGYQNVAVIGHEMGHSFGLPHSSFSEIEVYDNEWDVMSDTWTGCYNRGFSDPVYGCLGQHTISYHKDKLGWIPAGQRFTPAWGTSTTITLEQLALPQTNNYKMAKIPIGGSSTHFYTVEARRLNGYDAGLPGNAVVIHEVDTNRSSSPAHLIDLTANGNTGDAGAMWTVGEVFRDNANKVFVAVVGSTASGFRVNITLGKTVYFISGTVNTANATINYTGGSATSGSNGSYVINVPPGWSGTVTPSKPNFIFSPASRSYSSVVSDKVAQNYTTAAFYTISGNAGAAGVKLSYTVNGTAKTTISQANGNYSLQVPGGWTGLVTPSHPCFNISPANLPYYNLASNQTAQNYNSNFNSASGCTDIDVLVTGVNRGNFGLSTGESARANFVGVNDGSVKIVSNNGVPLIAAERLIYKVNGVDTSFSEMMALPNSQLDNVYWLPWYNNNSLDTQLRFGNTTGSTATVSVYIKGVPTADSPFTIGPYSDERKSYVGVNDGPVQIVSNQNIVVSERVIYKVNGVDTSFTEMMALPENQLDTRFWLPWYNNVGLDTQLRFANVSATDTTVHVYIGGQEMGTGFPLAAGESTRMNFDGVNAGPVEIVSDQNLVASARLIYKANGVDTSFSEIMALPNNQLHTVYWLPWYNNINLDTQLRLANVTNTDATVHIYIGGQEMGTGFDLPAGESTRLSFAGVNDGPVQIVSDQNIVVAERVIHAVNNIPSSFSEMMALPEFALHFSNWLPYYNNVGLDTQLRFGVP